VKLEGVEQSDQSVKLTAAGAVSGTPAFMAPEVVLGDTQTDHRVDIYSLGCVAYFLLTGERVFSGESAVATALAHVQNTPLPPSARSSFEIAPALDALVLDCLAKDPAARPASVAVVDQRLAAAVSPDAWTVEAAQAWWDQHQPLSIVKSADAPPTAATEPARPTGPPRFWPRLDRQARSGDNP
jgi:serine/threonine-protein kinase